MSMRFSICTVGGSAVSDSGKRRSQFIFRLVGSLGVRSSGGEEVSVAWWVSVRRGEVCGEQSSTGPVQFDLSASQVAGLLVGSPG